MIFLQPMIGPSLMMPLMGTSNEAHREARVKRIECENLTAQT